MGRNALLDGELMDIVPIHPANLHPVWEKVREGLTKIKAKIREDWMPEDVYHALKAGEAQLFLAIRDQGFAGFFILRKVQAEYSRENIMHVWCAYSEGDDDVFEQCLDFIREAATKAGCKRLTFGSQRKGWMKRFRVREITYEIPL